MTELTAATVRLGFAGLYVALLPLMGVLTMRTTQQVRRYALLLTASVALVPIGFVLRQAGVGQLTVAGGVIDVVNLVQSTIGTIILYGVVLGLVDTSRRMTGLIIGISLIPTYAGSLLGLVGDSFGVLGIVYLAGSFLPFPVVLYLFVGPVWRSAASVSRRRRLIHWKARNILLFAYAMVLAYTLIAITGLVVDPVLNAIIVQYSFYMLSGGVAVYLLYNLTRLRTTTGTELISWGTSS